MFLISTCNRTTLAFGAALLLTASAAHAGYIVNTNFAGPSLSVIGPLNGGNFGPSDMGGAAGPTRVVQFINGGFTIYDRTGNVTAATITDKAFWNNAGISTATTNVGVSDTRIIYDTDSQRWFAAEINVSNTDNKILLAVSNSSDPGAGFKAVEFVANTGSHHFADQPTLGLDKNGVYLGTSNFLTASTGYAGTVSLFSIPKADLIGATPSLARLTRFEDQASATRGFEPDPVVNLNGTGGHILAIDDVSFGRVDRTNISGASGAGATLSATQIINILHDSAPASGRQPDGTQQIDTADDRINGTIYEANGFIYAAHNVGEINGPGATTRSLIDWMIIDAATGSVTAEGLIGDPNFDFYYGSIAANVNGDFVIGYNRSGTASTGAAGNLSSYADVCHFNGTTVTCETPLLLSQGAVNNYHLFTGAGERWGDYSAASIDPNDPNSFWVFTGVVKGAANWGTQVSQISAAPEPSTCALLLLGFGGLGLVRARKNRL